MSRFTKLMVGAALLAMTATAAAKADPAVTNIRVSNSAYVINDIGELANVAQGPSATSLFAKGPVGNVSDGGSDFNSFVDVGRTAISFESSNAIAGRSIYSSAGSQVEFDFNNDTDGHIAFHSTITPAGLGFYLANVNGDCAFQGCGEAVGSSLSSLRPNSDSSYIGSVGFDFHVQDTFFDGEVTRTVDLFSVQGSLDLSYNDRCDGVCITRNLGSGVFGDGTGARGLLSGFTQSTLDGDNAILGYAWDETDVFASLGSGLHHITYSTSVFSGISADCLSGGACLVGFSGFGDPVGRGGGIDSADEALTAFDFLSSMGFSDGPVMGGPDLSAGSGALTGIRFTPETLGIPRYVNGMLVFDTTVAGVPEPASWATMILGFGLAGAMLRRRRFAGANA
jgi:hypothetical protein